MTTRGQPGEPGEPGGPGAGAGGRGGRGGDSAVTEADWHKWKRASLAAWIALGLATTGAFYVAYHERADRIDQAATVIRVRCADSRANRQAIRAIAAAELVEHTRGPERAEAIAGAFRRILDGLPPVQDCERQALEIRGLGD